MSRQEILDILGLNDRKSLSDRYFNPALAAGMIEMTVPDKYGFVLLTVQRFTQRQVQGLVNEFVGI